MNKKVKAMLLVLCALILVVGSVMGTFAYLTSKTDPITNTFTVGSVSISMVESKTDEYGVPTAGTTATGNSYKLIPGHKYVKDPTITVSDDSEDAYIFVKIENGLGTAATLEMNSAWVEIDSQNGIWVYADNNGTPKAVAEDQEVTPFTAFTFATDADPADYANARITITAYAIQADGFSTQTATEIWSALNTQLTPHTGD